MIHPFGTSAVLLEFESLDQVLDAHRQLDGRQGLIELVPAARTLLAVVDQRVLPIPQLVGLMKEQSDATGAMSADNSVVDIDISYDGPDLADTAEILGISPEALVAAHSAAKWTVAFTGFAPGFAYLVSPDWPYQVPRLATPRTKVPAGSVGLAAEFTGAYPRETPGGWRLIGTTQAELFNPTSASPTLLLPNTRVRFTPTPHTTTPRRGDGIPKRRVLNEPAIRIEQPGLLATVQDAGRPGHAHLGVARSGAFDQESLRIANRILGNSESAAAIEVTMGGFRATAIRDCWFAVTGAPGRVLLDGKDQDAYVAHPWRAGSELHLDWFTRGTRAYLAIRGGVLEEEVLGSRSTNTLAGLGPSPLIVGVQLAIGEATLAEFPVSEVPIWAAPGEDALDLELAAGPRADWFSPGALETLFDSVWLVSHDANRVGIRLEGPELARTHTGELPSEGMIAGAMQVPPNGQPVILGPDGPVTGGYPVIAVLTERSLNALAQARPGTQVRFRHARRYS